MRETKLFQGFGHRVQQLRKQKGWSQDRLAEAIGKSTNTISNIERGVLSTRLKTVAQLAKVFGVQLVELFEPDPTAAASVEQRRELAKFLGLVKNCDVETIRHLRGLVTSALEVKRTTKSKARSRR